MLLSLLHSLFLSPLSKIESKEESATRSLLAKLTTLAQALPITITFVLSNNRNMFAPEVPDSYTYLPLAAAGIILFGLSNILARRKHFLYSILVVNFLFIGIMFKITYLSPSILSFSIGVNFAIMALIFSTSILKGRQSLIPAALQVPAVWTCFFYSISRALPSDSIIVFILFHVICATLYFSIFLRRKNEAQFLREIESNAKSSQIGFMAAGIAHEINNPLTILSLNALMLEKD
jgi:signal transduction histidine kinase